MDVVARQVEFIRSRYIDQVVGAAIFPAVTGIPQAGNPIGIVSDFFLRSATKTLDAICMLCETRFSDVGERRAVL